MNTNPYAAPAVIAATPEDPRAVRSCVPPVFVSLAVAAFCGFTVLLLASSGTDHKGGLLFLISVPVMLIWGVSVWRTDRYGAAFGVAAAGTQGLVTRLMIVRGIGDDEIVYAINGGIILVLILLSAMC